MSEGRTSGANVGASVGRVDGAAKVTGAARYVDDIEPMEGELHGLTVRSRVARGVISEIVLDPSFDWTDVVVVLAEDVPENVVQLIVDDQPVLAADRINHRYEPIALLACADRDKLARAAEHVLVEVESQPAIFDASAALADGAEVIWGEDNVQTRYLITKGEADVAESEAAIDILLSECDVVVAGRYSTHHQEQLYIETQGMVAWWDDAGVHATGSLQCPYYVHKAFKRCFGLEPDRIHITQAVTGGGFGGKEEYPSLIALHAALLAKKAGRPVRMIYDRVEDIEATTKRHPSVCQVTTGCDRDGRMRVLKLDVVFDAGAYVTLTPVVLSRGVLHAGGAYVWDHVRIEGVSVATNTPPNGAFRGFGAPQTIWAVERHLDSVARELGLDPGELKRANLLDIGGTTPTGQVLRSSVGGAECVEKAFAASGYLEKRRGGPMTLGRKARGIGCAMFMHGGGFTGSGERMLKGKVAVDLEAGGCLLIRSASTDIGQGTETIFSQIAADAADIPIERVKFAVPSTTTVPDSGPTVASRTVMVVGSIVERAAADIAGRVVAEQSSGGGTWIEAADRLLAREGEVTCLLQYEPPDWVKWDEKAYKGDAYPVYAWMCDVAEVEVDLDTFEVQVIDFWQAADVGKAINPVMCVGQLEGGTLQAIGWALCEELVWQDGRIVNPRMTNYIIPTALDAPPFTTLLVEQPYEGGPGGGAKGIGELPMDGGAAAVAAAVEHATGIAMSDLPLTPERLFAAHRAMPAKATPAKSVPPPNRATEAGR
jgi:CO/xanthine dehydrogenase Mo-binding subunit